MSVSVHTQVCVFMAACALGDLHGAIYTLNPNVSHYPENLYSCLDTLKDSFMWPFKL